MKILYLVFQALLGGHVISAITIASEMKNYDVDPVFCGADGAMKEEIMTHMPFEKVDIPIFHGSRQSYFTWSSFSAVSKLRDVIKKHNIELIHAFDARSYFHAYLAGILEKKPVLCTLCGGVDPYYNLPISPKIIVFSEEQRHKMIKTYHWQPESVETIRTRLNIKKITSELSIITDNDAMLLGLDISLPKIMMISSFDGTKIQSINKVLDAVDFLFSKGLMFQIVFIGGKGELFEKAKRRANEINQRFGNNRVLMTGPIINAFKLLQRADVVLGVGRSAFEGMAYAKPTLIVGENGYAGLVSPGEVESIAYFNFSGRNQSEVSSAENLAIAMERLLSDEALRATCGEFGRNYVSKEIDVAQGANRIYKIYERLLYEESGLTDFSKWVSFLRCLAPIILDNGLHTLKQSVKAFIRYNNASKYN